MSQNPIMDMKLSFKQDLDTNNYNLISSYNMNLNDQEIIMLNQEYQQLLSEKLHEDQRNLLTYKNVSIWNETNYQPTKIVQTNKHNYNVYADKLLIHLVVEEKFNFSKISQIMLYSFQHEQNKYSQRFCRQRWYQLHRDRQILPQIKKKQMQSKKIKSIMSMNDPFLLYNLEEKLQQMNKDQNQSNKIFNQSNKQQKQLDYTYEGYNIFKDSIRKINDMDKYNQLHKQMKEALDKASKFVQLQKPMLYTPYYNRLQQFEVFEQQLTTEKMQQMMSHPIQIQFLSRQLKVLDINQQNFQSKVKKQVEKKVKQKKIRNQQEFQIEQNWDQYESD